MPSVNMNMHYTVRKYRKDAGAELHYPSSVLICMYANASVVSNK